MYIRQWQHLRCTPACSVLLPRYKAVLTPHAKKTQSGSATQPPLCVTRICELLSRAGSSHGAQFCNFKREIRRIESHTTAAGLMGSCSFSKVAWSFMRAIMKHASERSCQSPHLHMLQVQVRIDSTLASVSARKALRESTSAVRRGHVGMFRVTNSHHPGISHRPEASAAGHLDAGTSAARRGLPGPASAHVAGSGFGIAAPCHHTPSE